MPEPSRSDAVGFVAAEPPSEGNSDARLALRRARDSLIRAEAEAMSGLFCRALEMRRESDGSSKRLHQRERSRVGEAAGKWPEFFQSAGSGSPACEDGEVTRQALKPMRMMLECKKNRADCTVRRIGEEAEMALETLKLQRFQNKICPLYAVMSWKLAYPADYILTDLPSPVK